MSEKKKIYEAWTGPGRKDEEITKFLPEHDGIHIDINEKGTAEWWYFDAILDNGYTVVGFFRARHERTGETGVEIMVYKPNDEKIQKVVDYKRTDFTIAEKTADLSIGKNYIKVDYSNKKLPTYEIFLDEDDMGVHLTYKSKVEGWMPGKGEAQFGNKGHFGWAVAIPQADVEGTIKVEGKEMSVKGVGYHDHNWLNFGMPLYLKYWYMGHYFAGDFSFIYAYIKCNKRMDYYPIQVAMLAKGEDIFLSSGEYELIAEDFEYNEKANNKYPKSLTFKFAENQTITMKVERIVDADNLLNEFGPLVRFIGKHLLRLKPGYFRFNSKVEFDMVIEGESFKEKGDMLHEQIILSSLD